MRVDRVLSLLDEAVIVTVEGTLSEGMTDALLVARVGGPADISQVGQADIELPEAATLSQPLAEQTGGAAGPWTATVVLPAGTPAKAGAYVLAVRVISGGVTRADGSAWFGKAVAQDRPSDIAFVWPVALGVHRDPGGAFFDTVLESAVAPSDENAAGLQAFLAAGARIPGWRFTLAVEPILLTQLRDMADGYVRLDTSGSSQEVDTGNAFVQHAGSALTAFKQLAGMEFVETAAMPYAGPVLASLAAEGWRDGFEQLQLGKQELLQTLGLGATPVGAYAPGLDVTTGSLAYYGEASIDHVVVDSRLAANLTEEVAQDSVAVRVRDSGSHRVTLVFADSRLRALVAPPWDVGVLFAGLAAVWAGGTGGALVIAPDLDFVLPPAEYLENIGATMSRLDWVNTLTVTELLRAHPPGTRPIMFARDRGGNPGYIEASLLASLRAAHAVVEDLAAATDGSRGPVGNAYRLLYAAESRWWWLPQTGPDVASIGLAYAEGARALAQGELAKARFLGVDRDTLWGARGVIGLEVENRADYPLKVEMQLAGEGLVLPDGERLEVELPPGRSVVPVSVQSAEGDHRLEVRMVAGASLLGQLSHAVRFTTAVTLLPWLMPIVVVLGAVAYVFLRRRGGRRAAPP